MPKPEPIPLEKCYKCDRLPKMIHRQGKLGLFCTGCRQQTKYHDHTLEAVEDWNTTQEQEKLNAKTG